MNIIRVPTFIGNTLKDSNPSKEFFVRLNNHLLTSYANDGKVHIKQQE